MATQDFEKNKETIALSPCGTIKLSPSGTLFLSPSGLTGGSIIRTQCLMDYPIKSDNDRKEGMGYNKEEEPNNTKKEGALKKSLITFLLCGILLTSSVAVAEDTTTDTTTDTASTETCADGAGTVVIGAVTGHKYCRSLTLMNWWNAYAWCDAMGRRLFLLTDCACDASMNCYGKCPELVEIAVLLNWTGSPRGEHDAYVVNSSNGDIGAHGSRTVVGYNTYPLCY